MTPFVVVDSMEIILRLFPLNFTTNDNNNRCISIICIFTICSYVFEYLYNYADLYTVEMCRF